MSDSTNSNGANSGIENIANTATIGDIYRAYGSDKLSLTDFVDQNFVFFATRASDGFDLEHRQHHPNKNIYSIEFYVKPNAGVETLAMKVVKFRGGELVVNNQFYWQLLRQELLLTEATFGPIAAANLDDKAIELDPETRRKVYDTLKSLQDAKFAQTVTVNQGGEMSGWRAMDINCEEAFYNASYIFGGIDLRQHLQPDGRSLRFDGELQRRLAEVSSRYPQESPYILPTQLIFLTPETLWRLWFQPPLPRYSVNLRDRLIFHDYLMSLPPQVQTSGT